MAAVLVLVMALSGAGRGWAAAPDATGELASIVGVQVHICHDGPADNGDHGSSRHDCCDLCALCAPMALTGEPVLTAPNRVEHFASHAEAIAWAPAVARPRTPRLSQGPPAA